MADKILKIVLAVLASFGGISGIFYLVVKKSSEIIAERLKKKYDLKLNEELERYKANIDNKIYISKTKFDAEFDIYRRLSKVFFDLVKNISILIPAGVVYLPVDQEKQRQLDNENYLAAKKSYIIAQVELISNAPFIPERFYNEYKNIQKLCKEQLDEFDLRSIPSLSTQEEKETISKDARKITTDINVKFKNLNNEIREYLNSLDVIE
jgi:hypothetical protein